MIDDTVGEYVCLNCDSKGFSYDIKIVCITRSAASSMLA